MKAIIPTGGRGTRMQPVTFSANKHFIPIANKPLIYYPIETIAKSGIRDVAITYNPSWLNVVKQYLGDGSKWGLKFTYVLQENPMGLANIFQVCEEFVGGDAFVLHLGDNIFCDGIKEFVDYFVKEKPNGLVAKVHHPENSRMGVPYFDSKGRLVKYVEKPKNPPHDFAIPGLYFFDSTVFKCFSGKDKILPSPRGEYEISSPYQWLIDHKYRVDVLEYEGEWLDPGKFDDWLFANKYLLDTKLKLNVKSKVDKSVSLSGNVEIGRNCTINKSHIKGPVSIGDNVSIIDSVIGPHASISSGCRIERSIVKNSVFMEGVSIVNIGKTVENSLIGTDARISGKAENSNSIELFIGEKSNIKI